MHFPDQFSRFNFIEGSFWIFLSVVALVIFLVLKKNKYKKLSFLTFIILFLFGISDLVEIKTGGFLWEPVWLLVSKAVCVAGLIISFLWYLKIRSAK